jgi:exosortase/archaeosortase family protein
LHFVGSGAQLIDHNVIRHENGVAVRIVWSCTGLKQAYIFFCIIAFYSGNLKQKIWFIPLGLLLIYIVNILRITAITALIEPFPEYFDLLHEHLFKYLFYIIMFGMWVFWEEKVKR